MYYHEISLFPQLRFLLYSVFSGIIDGVLCVLLCNPLFGKKARAVIDFIFVLISAFIIVFTNLVYQEAALRLYELLGFFFGLILIILTLKHKTDKFFLKRKTFYTKRIIFPIKNKSKLIFNKIKIILKKVTSLLYNLNNRILNKSKEKNADNGCQKEEKKE